MIHFPWATFLRNEFCYLFFPISCFIFLSLSLQFIYWVLSKGEKISSLYIHFFFPCVSRAYWISVLFIFLLLFSRLFCLFSFSLHASLLLTFVQLAVTSFCRHISVFLKPSHFCFLFLFSVFSSVKVNVLPSLTISIAFELRQWVYLHSFLHIK